MNAKEAARRAAAVQEANRQAAYERQRAQGEQERVSGLALGDRILPDIRKQIREAVKKGWTGTMYELGRPDDVGSWAVSRVREVLEKDGYRVSSYVDERNMGDNEYPCDIKELVLTVTWGKQDGR